MQRLCSEKVEKVRTNGLSLVCKRQTDRSSGDEKCDENYGNE